MVKGLAKVLKNGGKCQNPKAGRTRCNLRETVTCTDILRGTPPGPSSSCQQVSWLAGRCVFRPSQEYPSGIKKENTHHLQLRGQLRLTVLADGFEFPLSLSDTDINWCHIVAKARQVNCKPVATIRFSIGVRRRRAIAAQPSKDRRDITHRRRAKHAGIFTAEL